MAIYYTGSASAVANIKQTPGAITDTFANRPAATAVTQYTLFFASDTGAIYQSSGGSWVQMGGGGGSQTFQQVLTTGSTLTTNNIIDNSGYIFTIFNTDINTTNAFSISDTGVVLSSQDNSNNNNVVLTNYYGKLQTACQTNANFGFYVDDNTGSFVAGNIGNPTTVYNPYLTIETGSPIAAIRSGSNAGILNGISFDFSILSNTYLIAIGDNLLNYNGTALGVDVFNGRVYTVNNGTTIGIDIDFTNQIFQFGDYVTNSNFIKIDKANKQTDINSEDKLYLLYDDKLFLEQTPSGSVAITTTTHSGASGLYLKVNVDGVNYVIELRNP